MIKPRGSSAPLRCRTISVRDAGRSPSQDHSTRTKGTLNITLEAKARRLSSAASAGGSSLPPLPKCTSDSGSTPCGSSPVYSGRVRVWWSPRQSRWISVSATYLSGTDDRV